MLKLILIRHAESIANARGIKQGQKIDEPLSEIGKIQAIKTAESLREEKIEVIISSDLKRALHTAEEISKVFGKKIIADKRLREMDHDNEKNEELVRRCKDFLEEIKKYKGTVVVVGHGGVNKTILAISTGDREKGAEIFNNVKQYNACINTLFYKNKEWIIEAINDVSHLNDSEITKQKQN
ncbi:MAG: histidine phosphatase family protein [Candidatus Nanoarchaeia archaeon]